MSSSKARKRLRAKRQAAQLLMSLLNRGSLDDDIRRIAYERSVYDVDFSFTPLPPQKLVQLDSGEIVAIDDEDWSPP